MTSICRSYSQRDIRIEPVSLTGYISNNGSITGSVADQHPAYAEIDLTKSNNFSIDTRVLTLRTDSPNFFLLRIYISSSKSLSCYPNLEFDIFVTPPTDDSWLFIEIYADKANAENAQLVAGGSKRLYSISNEIPSSPGDYSDQTGVISFKVFSNSIVLKGMSPYFSV